MRFFKGPQYRNKDFVVGIALEKLELLLLNVLLISKRASETPVNPPLVWTESVAS